MNTQRSRQQRRVRRRVCYNTPTASNRGNRPNPGDVQGAEVV